jgi:hypothetical protein
VVMRVIPLWQGRYARISHTNMPMADQCYYRLTCLDFAIPDLTGA